ncbi:hypothetical protein CSIRO_1751 [Bradyrhizobiaceae bacterium SG-6C]|nr:hypothetical protein CSIRO_1751 [Bradyrhizobiaceae bacterium SG-6C]
MKRRRDQPRVTPDLIAFHRLNARRLRLEARRAFVRALVAWLAGALGRR